jgi:hypothetical protein
MRITMRHHFDFGVDRHVVGDDLVTPSAWDALRVDTAGPFALARSREELERNATARTELADRARAIHAWFDTSDVRKLASYGVGAAVLEWWLIRERPQRELLLAEYAPQTLDRLKALFPGVEVHRHDLLRDGPLQTDAHLFHRIDTELSDEEWRDLLQRFSAAKILVVATEVATPRRLLSELLLRVRRRRLSRAGWLRTRDVFEALWRETHDAQPLRLHDLDGWALTPREL